MKNKKNILITILTITMMLMMFVSCSNKQTQDTKIDNQTMSLKLSDNLPEFTIQGNYTKGKLDIEENGEFETLYAYDGDDNAEYRYVRVYKWSKEDKGLLEETIVDAQFYYPEQNPSVIICNFWNEPNDYEYAYYAAIKDNKLFVQDWTFLDGDYFYQICVGYDLVIYTVEGTNIQFSLPKQMKQTKTDTALMKFVDPDYEIGMSELPNVEIFLNDTDFEYTKENITKTWNLENVEVTEHVFKSNDTTKQYPDYIIDCQYEENGKTIMCHEDIAKVDDKYFGVVFSYDKNIEFSEYIENSYNTILYTIAVK